MGQATYHHKQMIKVQSAYRPSYPQEPLPAGMSAVQPDNHHNTQYWGKRAMAVAPGESASATDYYWALVQSAAFQASAVPLMVKRPLEHRVYYSYQGGGSTAEGTVRQVTHAPTLTTS